MAPAPERRPRHTVNTAHSKSCFHGIMTLVVMVMTALAAFAGPQPGPALADGAALVSTLHPAAAITETRAVTSPVIVRAPKAGDTARAEGKADAPDAGENPVGLMGHDIALPGHGLARAVPLPASGVGVAGHPARRSSPPRAPPHR